MVDFATEQINNVTDLLTKQSDHQREQLELLKKDMEQRKEMEKRREEQEAERIRKTQETEMLGPHDNSATRRKLTACDEISENRCPEQYLVTYPNAYSTMIRKLLHPLLNASWSSLKCPLNPTIMRGSGLYAESP
ncbi:MAG: hypothetical protein JOS17DRAFT_779280 [Linnemannia elongata]|nr:MAG: hypothetical protein JOS17DRAFT_779280 [Linnemannia elongata]